MFGRGLLTTTAAALMLLASAGSATAAQPYPVNFHTFDLASGARSGLTLSGGSLKLATGGLGSLVYADPYANANGDGVDGSGTYQLGTWTSDVFPVSFGFNELVSSWNANAGRGPGSSPRSCRSSTTATGRRSGTCSDAGRTNDSDFHRTSVGGQGDADGFVSIDTFFAKDHPAIAYRLRLTLSAAPARPRRRRSAASAR